MSFENAQHAGTHATGVTPKAMIAIALVFLMVMATLLAMARTASASPGELPDETHEASLTIHKYALPDAVNAAGPADGTQGSAQSIPSQATPLAGIDFTIVRAYSRGEADALISQGVAKESDFEQAGVSGENAEGYLVRSGDQSYTQTTGSDGTATFNLTGNMGVYLVREQADPRIEIPAASFLASVPMPDPDDESSWLYDVHVYPKNYELDIDKTIVTDGTEVMADANAVGEANVFRIESDIPTNIGACQSYLVTDQLDWRLTTAQPAPEACVVTVGDTQLKASEDYVANVTSTTDSEGRSCQLVTWDFSCGLATLQELVQSASEPGACRVRIEFVARLNENAVSGTLDNGARLEVVNQQGDSHTVDSDRPTLSFAAIRITKTAFDDSSKLLSGARFRIASSYDDANAQNWMHRLAKDGSDLGVWEQQTDAEGLATFGGLDFDLANGTDYFLVEVQAPDGYQALSEPVRVHVGPNGAGQSSENPLVEVQVLNSPVPELPSTGGNGTLAPIVGASMLVVGGLAGGIALVSSRRRGR